MLRARTTLEISLVVRSRLCSPQVTTAFVIRQPIPNWVGHVLLAGIVQIAPAWAADRIMTSVTLVGFAAAIFWLRLQIAGSGPATVIGTKHLTSAMAAPAMNMTWLFGFTSFTASACLFPITLGFWWPRRDHLGAVGVAGLWVLLVLGYFCHLVSLGLTALGLCVLALASPLPRAEEGTLWRRMCARLLLCEGQSLSLVPVGLVYLGLAIEFAAAPFSRQR